MPSHDKSDDFDEVMATSDSALRLTWTFQVSGSPVNWMWRQRETPPLDSLEPVRRPASSKKNRHIPATVYSMTNQAMLSLESGLEHDLVRRLDRESAVVRLVPQPMRLSWKPPATRHTPDLLSIDERGSATVWDVRAPEDQDDDFASKSAITRHACAAVGWDYQVFTGLHPIERLNLVWLQGFRRCPPWGSRFEETIRQAGEHPGATLGSLLNADDGTGELKATVWHMLWCGALHIDLTTQWTEDTPVGTITRGVK